MVKSKRVVNAFLKVAYDFSSVQMEFPGDISNEILTWGKENIPKNILVDKGLEDNIHVTVKYGIHIVDFTEIREVFKDENPVEITLGKISLFNGDENDVVKIDIHSPDLHRLNSIISKEFETTDTYPKYIPHATIAYVKKGCGAHYDGDSIFEGRKVLLDSVFFSGKDNRYTEFKIKNAVFNQSTWLPGRHTRSYPTMQKTPPNDKGACFTCVSCNLRRYSFECRCPRCGHQMKKS